jgi:RNA polymerase sigma factor (sigma-70 family)
LPLEQSSTHRIFDLIATPTVRPDVIAAFKEVCESQLEAVYAYMRYRVAGAEIAEELTHTTFLKARERLRSFDRERGEMSHWIFGIARHVVTDYLRARRRWVLIPIDYLAERSSRDVSPEQDLSNAETRQRLAVALRRLRNRDRDVLGMRFGAGLTNREIAGVTGFSERHVAVIVRRALARLRAELESRGVSHA